MSKDFLKRLRHRVKIGRIKEVEDEKGDIIQSFFFIKEVWADIKPITLTHYLPLGVSNESNPRQAKCFFKVKIRANAFAKGRHEEINALIWNNKILNNFYNFNLDACNTYVEGLFYDQGQEDLND